MKTNKKLKKLIVETAKELNITIEDLIVMWHKKNPHFGGNGPHRYDGNDKYCKYCNKPINYDVITLSELFSKK